MNKKTKKSIQKYLNFGTLIGIIIGIFIPIISNYIQTYLSPHVYFNILCEPSGNIALPDRVSINNTGNAGAKGIQLRVYTYSNPPYTNSSCSIEIPKAEENIFKINNEWYLCDGNMPPPPPLDCLQNLNLIDNVWPINSKLSVKCSREPMKVKVLISGDNFYFDKMCSFGYNP